MISSNSPLWLEASCWAGLGLLPGASHTLLWDTTLVFPATAADLRLTSKCHISFQHRLCQRRGLSLPIFPWKRDACLPYLWNRGNDYHSRIHVLCHHPHSGSRICHSECVQALGWTPCFPAVSPHCSPLTTTITLITPFINVPRFFQPQHYGHWGPENSVLVGDWPAHWSMVGCILASPHQKPLAHPLQCDDQPRLQMLHMVPGAQSYSG